MGKTQNNHNKEWAKQLTRDAQKSCLLLLLYFSLQPKYKKICSST